MSDNGDPFSQAQPRNRSWHDELAARHKLTPEKPISKRWVAHMKSIQAETKGAA